MKNNNVNQGETDYASTPVPETARLPWQQVLSLSIGVMGAMIFLQLPGQLSLSYGALNTGIALVYATVATGLLGVLFGWIATRSGRNIGLVSQLAGFGKYGSAIAGFCYALNFFVLAGIESSIMATSLHQYWPIIPLAVFIIVVVVANALLCGFGIHFLNHVMRYSLPVYLLLLLVAIWLAHHNPSSHTALAPQGFNLHGTLMCISVFNGIVALQALLIADYARYLPKDSSVGKIVVVSFLPQIASFLVMGFIAIWLTHHFGQSNPGIYLVQLMGVIGAIYTIISQLRINLINIYSGSLALNRAFNSLAGNHLKLSHSVWITAVVILILMFGGILDHAPLLLNALGIIMFAWAGSLVGGVLIHRVHLNEDSHHSTHNNKALLAFAGGILIGVICALQPAFPLLAACASAVAAIVGFLLHLALTHRAAR